LGAVSYSPSIVTMVVLHHFRNVARYWSKIVIFFHTPMHSPPPPLGGYASEYCYPVLCGKTKMVWLPSAEKV